MLINYNNSLLYIPSHNDGYYIGLVRTINIYKYISLKTISFFDSKKQFLIESWTMHGYIRVGPSNSYQRELFLDCYNYKNILYFLTHVTKYKLC